MDEIIKELRAKRMKGRLASNCRAVIAHESDPASGELANQLCRSLEQEFGGNLNFEFGWWAFDRLADSKELQAAAEHASEADLILFSVHAGNELPRSVQEWIEAGLARRRKTGGAVAVLTGPAQASTGGGWPIDCYLRYLAERAAMDFWVSTPCET